MNNLDYDNELKGLMKGIRLESPGAGFSLKVMDAIRQEAETSRSSVNRPILGKNFLIFVALFVLLMVFSVVFYPSEPLGPSSFFDSVFQKLPSADLSIFKLGIARIWEQVGKIPYLFAAALLAVSLLLALDKYLNSRHIVDPSL